MFRKVLKSFYCLALLLFMAGIFCLVPTNFKKVAKADQASLSAEESSSVDLNAPSEGNSWIADEIVLNANENDIVYNGNVYGRGMYIIKTANGLANVAYNVNNGNSAYASGNFILAANIDLSGAIWTPIGTAAHPFEGVFLGEGYSISNINIDDNMVDSASAAGLFGNTKGASISELIIKDSCYINSSKTKGALVGNAKNTEFIACFDMRADKSTIKTIGTSSGCTFFFSKSHASGGYTSTAVKTESTRGSFTGDGVTTNGTVVYYVISGNAIFRRGDNNWIDTNAKRLRVVTTAGFADYGTSVTNPLFVSYNPRLRVNVGQNANMPYYYRVGYKFTGSKTVNDEAAITITDSDFTATNIKNSFNYGSGYDARNSTVTFKYDESYSEFFAAHPGYKERVGYGLASIYQESGTTIDNSPKFYYNYPKENGTTYFTWNVLTDRSFNFKFVSANNDDMTFNAWTGNDFKVSVSQQGNSALKNTQDGTYYRVEKVNSSTSVVIKFTLKPGYEVSLVNKNADDGEDGLGGIDKVEQMPDSSQTSGVYTNFINFTGQDPNYSASNKNNDSYKRVSTSIVQDNPGAGFNAPRSYTVTINNIVGTNGNIFIAVQRVTQKVNVNFKIPVYGSEAIGFTCDEGVFKINGKVAFTFGLLDATNKITTKIDITKVSGTSYSASFEIKDGDNVRFGFVTSTDWRYFVLDHSFDREGLDFKYEGFKTVDVLDKAYAKEGVYSTRTNVESVIESSTVEFVIGQLRTFVNVKYVLDGAEVANDTKLKGVFLTINGLGGLGQGATAYPSLYMGTGESGNESYLGDTFTVTPNGYYRPTEILITGGNSQSQSIDIAGSNTGTASVFTVLYTGQSDPIYTITITLEAITHDIGNESFSLTLKDGLDGTSKNYDFTNNADFINTLFTIEFSKNSGILPEETFTVTIRLTNLGKALLYGSENDFVMDNNSGETVDGKLKGEIVSKTAPAVDDNSGVFSFDYKSGTNDYKFNLIFTFKQVEIRVNGLVDSTTHSPIDNMLANEVILPTTYRYGTDEGNTTPRLYGANGAGFGGISIHSQYFLVGWYLSNGNVVSANTSDYQSILYDTNLMEGYKALTSVNNSSFSIAVNGIVTPRTVHVTLTHGEVGKGELNDLTTHELTLEYGKLLSIPRYYTNLGYTFAKWLAFDSADNSITLQTGDIIDSLTVSGGNWGKLFGADSDDNNTWTSFYNNNDQDNITNNSQVDITLVAQWNAINYNINIDNGTSTHDASFQIGDKIYFETTNQKNGTGRFTVYRADNNGSFTVTSVQNVTGSSIEGYLSTGFSIQESSATFEKITNLISSGVGVEFILTLDNFKALLGVTNTSAESEFIGKTFNLTTERKLATYKVYIEGSTENYYNILINEDSADGLWGKDSTGVYVVVTYSEIPTLLDSTSPDFIFAFFDGTLDHDGKISIERNGYKFSGKFEGNSFDPKVPFNTTSDITVRPVFTRVDTMAQANIAWTDDVGALADKIFYLLNSHDITKGSLSDKVTSTEHQIDGSALILSNGDRLANYGFLVTYKDGSDKVDTINSETIYNINKLFTATNFDIQFFVTMENSLLDSNANKTYTVSSNPLSFEMKKNAFEFEENFVGIYNGTEQFVPATSEAGYPNANNYGTTYLKYSWSGEADDASRTSFDTSLIFNTANTNSIKVVDDYSVGSDRKISFNIYKGYFDSNGDVNGVSVSSSTVWSNLIEGVSRDGSNYSYIYTGLDIVKARFTISFGETSTYYFDNTTLIVYTHSLGNVSFSIGNVTFTYNLTDIIYIGSAISQDTTFTGADNSNVFEVRGLKVNGQDYANVSGSFEYVLDGTFNLLDSANALKLTYSPRYLTAANGKLSDTLNIDYKGSTETLYIDIDNVVVGNANEGDIIFTSSSSSQGTLQVANQVLFSFVNNYSSNLRIFVNKGLLNTYTLNYDICVDISTDRLLSLTLLTWNTSSNPASYQDILNTEFSDPAGNNIPKQNFEVLSTSTDATTFAILTDVKRVNINYNGGNNAGAVSESVYVSAQAAYTHTNPTHDYAGLSFDGYSYNSADITLTEGVGNWTFAVSDGGSPVNITALWKLNSVVASQKQTTFDFKASLTTQVLAISDIADITTLIGGTFEYTLAKEGGRTFTSTSNEFILGDASNRLPVSLSGEYTFTIKLTYTNAAQGSQTASTPFKVKLEITTNEIGIEDATPDTLVFNNKDRKDNILVNVRQNGATNETVTLNSLMSIGTGKYGVTTTIAEGNSVMNAGAYNISIAVATGYEEFFSVESGKGRIQVSIEKFNIVLSKYQSQISVGKPFGTQEPNPITYTINVTENSDDVRLNFERETGEAIGRYRLTTATIADDADKVNYTLDTTGYEAYFEITVPTTNLKIELDGSLNFVYNGNALVINDIEYDSVLRKYKIVASAGGEEVTQTFNMYYTSEANVIQIPEEEKVKYAEYIQFVLADNNSKNVGEYGFTVSLTEAGKALGWNGVEIVNTANAKVVISERTITVNSITKIFDQTNTFTWTNNIQNEGIDLAVSNIVDGDVITISGTISESLAGEQNVLNMKLDDISEANYILSYAPDMKALVNPSQEEVTVTSTASTNGVVYGLIKENSDLASVILKNIPLAYNGGAINNIYINVDSYVVTNGDYSNGDYLKVGERTIEFTLSSKNYTFTQSVGAVGQVYEETFTITFNVNKLQITITNSTQTITKEYDGNADLLQAFVNQNVNANNGYYTSNGILSGDYIKVVSGTYENELIGSGKKINLLNFDPTNDDSSNYDIDYSSVKGNIGNVELKFNKNPEPDDYTFVEDGEGFGNTGSISLPYTGNVDNDIINKLLDQSNFLTRKGYKQIGWKYDGVEVSTTMSNKADFLQDAVDGKATGITIDAIWQIDEYTITIVRNQSSLSPDLADSLTVTYYSSLNPEDISVTANEGYTFEGVKLSSENGVLNQTVNSTNVGSFNISKITGDMTVTIVTEEISIKIIIDYNNPEQGLTISASGSGWENTTERVLSYSQLIGSNLPTLTIDQANTFDFTHWTLNDSVNEGANIWERLGTPPTQDDLKGYTFVANWSEAALTINMTVGNGAIVNVYKDSVSEGNKLTPQGNIYNIHYNDNLVFDVVGNDWYKWTNLTINGNYQNFAGNTTATQATTGQFSLKAKGNLDITVFIDEIVVSILTNYEVPFASQVNEAVGANNTEYKISLGDVSIGEVVTVYTATAGTYEQDYWTVGAEKTRYDFIDKIQAMIISVLGDIPTMDSSLTLDAHWKGLEYTVTFYKNSENAEFVSDETFESGADGAIRTYIYGDRMTTLPELDEIVEEGMVYTWTNDNGETYVANQVFSTTAPSADLTMKITANWRNDVYDVTFIYEGITNRDKVEQVVFEDQEYISGTVLQAIYGQRKEFTLTLSTGYEVDRANVVINPDTNADFEVNGNTFSIINITEDVVVTLAIKAKDYKITIQESGYENINTTELDVAFDENILSKFEALTFDRSGYDIQALYSGRTVFATRSGSSWTFNGSFVQNNIYKHDGSLTLKPVYKANDSYITAVVTPVSDLVYNSADQTIANAVITTLTSSEQVVVGQILANGDRVLDIYYMLNGSRIEESADLSLIYRDALLNQTLVLVIEVQDTLAIDETKVTYKSAEVQVNIAKSDILTSGGNLESYYSGTSTFNATESNAYGTLQFTKGEAITELALSRVEIVDDLGLYDARSEKYNVKYYLSVIGSNFKVENYNNLTKDPDSNLYIYEVQDIQATIVVTPITLTFNEKAFENGQAQQVTSIQVTKPQFVSNFVVTINSIFTASEAVGNYTTAEQFDIDATITRDDLDKKSNFVFVIDGGFEIVASANAYVIDTGAKYFDTQKVEDYNSINTTVVSFRYLSTSQNITGSYFNYMEGGELIFSISSNGSYKPLIQVANGKEISFTFNIDGTMAVLAWTNDTTVDTLKGMLNVLETEGSRRITNTFTGASNYYPVVTDYKAVVLNYGDKNAAADVAYVQLGSSVEVPQPSWTGFLFSNWDTAGSSVTANGNTISANANARITYTTIVAIWELDNPAASVVNDTVTRSAKVDKGAMTDYIMASDVIGVDGISNINTTDITYTYTWVRGADALYTGETNFEVPANTTSSGEYNLIITASKDNYISKSTTLTFNIAITKLDIGELTVTGTQFIYTNQDYIDKISINISGNGIGDVGLRDVLDKQDEKTYYFTLSGKDNTEIRNAGRYTITLGLDDTVFNAKEFSQEIIILEYTYILDQNEIPTDKTTKPFGTVDPDFRFVLSVDYSEGGYDYGAGPAEDTTITLTRESGESVGSYSFTGATSSNDDNINIQINGCYFSITPSNETLNIKIDSKLSMTYNGSNPTFVTNYDAESGKWTIAIGQSVATISLTMTSASGTDQQLSPELYMLALKNLLFTMPNALDVGLYQDGEFVVTAQDGANFTKFSVVGQVEITQLGLVISSVNKVFDRTTDITAQTSVVFGNLVGSDDVKLSGQFNSPLVGTNIGFNSLTLTGAKAGNYYIANPDITGTITKLAITNVNLVVGISDFTYGQISSNTAIKDLLTLVGSQTLTLDGVTSDLANNFVSISSFSVSPEYLSSSNNLRAMQVPVVFTITSDNFTFNGETFTTYQIIFNITRFDLDLSALSVEISKNYDETDKLPDTLSPNLDRFIFEGDDVSIDMENSHYDNANIGKNKVVTIVIQGDDSANYNVTGDIRGSINEYTITFNVNATTEHADLVTDGAFVKDGLTPNVRNPLFTFSYPNTTDPNELIAQMTYPTRTGYKAIGWKYMGEDGNYADITADNILELLRNIAFDDTNVDASITIYTVWQIEDYKIDVIGNNISSFEITGDYYNPDNQTARYFSDVQISVVADKGFKIGLFNVKTGNYSEATLDDTGRNEGVATIKGVGSAITFEVTMYEIQITINIDRNIPQYTNQTDKNDTEITYNYSDLSNVTIDNLPKLTVTDGTYTHSGYSYGDDDTMITDQTLQEIVDFLLPNLEEDGSITIKAQWQGVEYEISFTVDQGSISGTNPIHAIYGSPISETLPTAVLPGRTGIWTDDNGVEYRDGDVFHTIGQNEGGVWKTTLHATWQNNTYALTVEFDEKQTVYVDGRPISTGSTFDVTYSETDITFTINSSEGYSYSFNTSALNGDYEEDSASKSVTIRNLVNDGTLTIVTERAQNRLQLINTKVADLTVLIDDQEQAKDITEFLVYTESTVKIVYNAVKGYEFLVNQANPNDNSASLSGSGIITTELSNDGKTLTLTWTGFTNQGTIIVAAKAGLNDVVIPDISQYYSSLSMNGASVDVTGYVYQARTDETLTIEAVLKYGYKDGILTSSIEELIESQECTYTRTDGNYRLRATLNGINEGFSLDFTASPRTYNFAISVKEGQEEFGEITSQATQTVAFGSDLALGSNTLRDDYIFAGWEFNGTILDYNENTSITLTEGLKSMLESVQLDGTINIFATYKEKKGIITFKAGNRGEFAFYQDGTESITINGGQSLDYEVKLETNIMLKLTPDEGYEFDVLNIDGALAQEDSDYTYDRETNTITIFLKAIDPIQSIEVLFKASDAYVHVQAAVQINYQLTYGTDVGGKVYIANEEGEKLDDSYYLDADGTMYFDYRLLSHTDDTIYFVAEPVSGFNVVLSTTTSGVVISEFDFNGVHIFSFSGIKDGTEILAIFTAVENTINVQFALDGMTDVVYAGRIMVDTASLLVRASGNNSSVVTVNAITGATVDMTINSQFSYNLMRDENGRLKYKIVYGDEEFDEGSIDVGFVSESDPYQNGFTNTSTFVISNVNADATIYIYVEPKVYDLVFYVNESTQVRMTDALVYGESFSLDSLTEEERATVFSTRAGFTLGGYYTLQAGQGVQYVDGKGNVLKEWRETGYSYNGLGYVTNSNFDPDTQTFTIYAAWLYDKSTITIDFNPEGFDDNLGGANIKDIVVNIDQTAHWISQDNKWYAEITAGATLKIQAYEYEGYEFKYWLVSVDGGEPVEKGASFEMSFTQGNYIIQAVYYPKFTLTVSGSGTSSLLQDGVALTGSSFDTSKYVTLEALPAEGYNFLYWENTATGEQITGEYNPTTGRYTYTFDTFITSPLNLVAVFEGKPVNVNIDTSNAGQVHNILGVYIDNEQVDNGNIIQAKVGQEIKIEAIKRWGYDFEFIGAQFNRVFNSNTSTYTFTYIINSTDLIFNGTGYDLNILVNATREDINITFNYKVENAVDDNEVVRAGSLYFEDSTGAQSIVNVGSNFNVQFGSPSILKVYASTNYVVSGIIVNDGILEHDITGLFTNGQLAINDSFILNYPSYELTIEITFSRLVWTSEEYRAKELMGSGSESDPYIIRDASEMAFVAYAVNNGLSHNGLRYSDAVYQVVADIDFYGKYWEPIGTEENPFNGTMFIDSYEMSNITLYRTYTNPELSFGGLFWHVTENANITQDTMTLVIVLSVVGGLILLLLLILLIVLLVRRNRKKKMEDIANA